MFHDYVGVCSNRILVKILERYTRKSRFLLYVNCSNILPSYSSFPFPSILFAVLEMEIIEKGLRMLFPRLADIP